jgi:hypothetical protein
MVVEALRCLNPTMLAVSLGCSLPSVYLWKRGAVKPGTVYRERLEMLLKNLKLAADRPTTH